ncbi:hypothetical protein CCR95_03850 [Thiocystis minor]|uniref:hypothetical protein n=1 Tax=Thiocystis minor TaxID=61597 RepID=UPI0019136075|nr:hypothetical protein [Thiocystis minor]MBK5963245.1 hypothetical protein [Thiocystis minor]
MTHSPCIFGAVPREGSSRNTVKCCQPQWQAWLPEPWQALAIVPQSFRVYREYEVPARRVIGDDQTGKPCFCASDYRLIEPRSDDDEEIYPALTYGESLQAWRLLDGRWLVRRWRQPFGEDVDPVISLGFDTRMPR